MRRNRLLLGLFAALLIAQAPSLFPQSAIPSSPSTLTAANPSSSAAPPAPPVATVKVVTDEYYGTKVADPYRYMEPGFSAAEVISGCCSRGVLVPRCF
jgi:hypothetical protein